MTSRIKIKTLLKILITMALKSTNRANMAMPKKNRAMTGSLIPRAPGNTMKIMGDDSMIKATTKSPSVRPIKPKMTETPMLKATGPRKIATKMMRTIFKGDLLGLCLFFLIHFWPPLFSITIVFFN